MLRWVKLGIPEEESLTGDAIAEASEKLLKVQVTWLKSAVNTFVFTVNKRKICVLAKPGP